MNYYSARPLADGSGWHYTCYNRRLGTWAVGYCAGHGPHDTEFEAQTCYTHYLLDSALRLDGEDPGTRRRCVVCSKWTGRYATVQESLWFLCDVHCRRDVVANLFGVVGSSISSY